MNVTINIPEELFRRAKQIAAEENVSVEELFASPFEERVLEFERLKERASRGSSRGFGGRCKVPAVEPPKYGRL